MCICPYYMQFKTAGVSGLKLCIRNSKSRPFVRFSCLNLNFDSKNLQVQIELCTFVNANENQIWGCTP